MGFRTRVPSYLRVYSWMFLHSIVRDWDPKPFATIKLLKKCLWLYGNIEGMYWLKELDQLRSQRLMERVKRLIARINPYKCITLFKSSIKQLLSLKRPLYPQVALHITTSGYQSLRMSIMCIKWFLLRSHVMLSKINQWYRPKSVLEFSPAQKYCLRYHK